MKTLVLIIIILTAVSCSNPTSSYVEYNYSIALDGNSPTDANGLYHLTLSRTTYQTTHRIFGKLTNISGANIQMPVQPVHFESSHFWWYAPGDTVLTIFRRNVDNNGQWVIIDTAYFVSPDSLSVPTTNPMSYTDEDGHFSNMIAPTIDMLGDTLTILGRWYSKWYKSDTVYTTIKIVLD